LNGPALIAKIGLCKKQENIVILMRFQKGNPILNPFNENNENLNPNPNK
jgi:hypothetical protein